MRNLDDSEKDFIAISLSNREGIEVDETDDTGIVIKNKPRKRKTPGYKKISHWIAGLFALPFLLTGLFFVALLRIQNHLGGKESLEWLSKQGSSEEIGEIISSAGFDWYPQFIEIYNYRGFIIAGTFTVCFIIVAGLIILDVNRNKDNEDESDS